MYRHATSERNPDPTVSTHQLNPQPALTPQEINCLRADSDDFLSRLPENPTTEQIARLVEMDIHFIPGNPKGPWLDAQVELALIFPDTDLASNFVNSDADELPF